MALPAPNLDDRKFQDIVTEARGLIPRHCPEWTDHNLSDPGITLIELFAWMVDLLLYRLNKVPDKNYIKFMDLIGVKLEPAQPAVADVTFRLTAPQLEPVVIPKDTEVATVRTETQDAVTFTTDMGLRIIVPKMVHCLVTRDSVSFHDYMPALKNPDLLVDIFEKVPQEDNALYVGYSESLACNTLDLIIEASIEGIGVDPRNPPLSWEYWDEEEGKWLKLRLESDSTGGLNRDGELILHVPYSCGMLDVNGQNACWIRCRAIKPAPGQRPYTSSPRVRSLKSQCIGGTVPASHAFRLTNEMVGRSNGQPGQSFYLHNTPVLPRGEGETLEVRKEVGSWEQWKEVKTFLGCGADDPVFGLDGVSGEIQFGPSIRQPDGRERRFGRIPPKGSPMRFSAYRCGGGVHGNIGERTLTVLKSSIAYVAWVINFAPAQGGTDSESLENAKLRAPQVLQARTRAVTAEDFEFLAREASPAVARAKCVSPNENHGGIPPGTVHLLIVPAVYKTDAPIPEEVLVLPDRIQREVEFYLDERRLIGTQVIVGAPDYRWVSVEARIKAKARKDPARVKSDVEKKLYGFINPVSGGSDKAGWAFGRDLFLSELYSVFQEVVGVDYVEEVKLYPVEVETGRRGEATTKVSVRQEGLVCSYQHEITVI